MGKYIMNKDSDLYAQNSTTVKVIDSSGNGSFQNYYFGNSTGTANLLASSAGQVYSMGIPINYGTLETVAWTSAAVTPSTLTNYGVTYITMTGTDPSSSPSLIYLAAPQIGVEKTIILHTTAAYANTMDIDLGAGVGVAHLTGSTTGRYISFSTLATEAQAVRMVGLTTGLWGVISVDSTVGGFGTASGIRSGTAVRTS